MTSQLNFLEIIQDDIQSVDERLRAQAEGYHPDISSALNLLLEAGGKRLRPAITILVGRMLKAPVDRLVTLASAIELLHTATLVHDDLIDGSLLRRGMPTLNSQWSPGATVLTGDFLFSRAAKLAADTESVPVIKLFSETLTIIVNGEITQLFTSRCAKNREGYLTRIYAKTASLIETSAKSAALISNSSPETVESMRLFGYNLGMAFQIIDDLLDFTSDPETLGKPVGSDLRQGLFTLPALIYNEQNPDDPDIAQLDEGNCSNDNGKIDRLIDAIRASKSIDLTYQEAERFISISLEHLFSQPPGRERSALEQLATYIIQREK